MVEELVERHVDMTLVGKQLHRLSMNMHRVERSLAVEEVLVEGDIFHR